MKNFNRLNTHALKGNKAAEILGFHCRFTSHWLKMNKQRNVLISSISKKVPLIEAVRAAMKPLGFTDLHGSDSNSNCLAQYFVDRFWHCPSLDQLTPEQILQYCLTHDIQAIIPTRNGELEFYATHRAFFKRHHVHVMISPLEGIEVCLDKKQFHTALEKNGFNCHAIPTEFSSEKIETSLYVVKERFGAGSLNIGLKLTKNGANAHAKELDHPIFQPYIEGREYSIDLYCEQSGSVKGCVVRHRDLIVNGESQITTTETHTALEELCSLAARALKLYGHVVFQALETADQRLYLIECNPRFGGASTLSVAAGLDSFGWFLCESLGIGLKERPFCPLEGPIRLVRYAADRMIPWS